MAVPFGFVDWDLIESIGLLLIVIAVIFYIVGAFKKKPGEGDDGGGGGGGPPPPKTERWNNVSVKVLDDATAAIIRVRADIHLIKMFKNKYFGHTNLATGTTDPVRMNKGKIKLLIRASGYQDKEVIDYLPGGGTDHLITVSLKNISAAFKFTKIDPVEIYQGSTISDWKIEGTGLLDAVGIEFSPNLRPNTAIPRPLSNTELIIPAPIRAPINAPVSVTVSGTDRIGGKAFVDVTVKPLKDPVIKVKENGLDYEINIDWSVTW